jgi:hypothetical protein
MIKTLPILLTGALVLVACSQATSVASPSPRVVTPTAGDVSTSPIYGRSTGEISTPISVLIVLSNAPRLDEPVQVTLIITATEDAAGTTAEILLPPGATAVDGVLSWTGDLPARQSRRLEATVTFSQEGNWTLVGRALRPAGGRNVWGDMAAIYLHITRQGGQVGFPSQPNAPHSGGQAPSPSTP